ncbi:carboxymuconolactone decarboxylase family protein [Amycolatopsis sp. H20-H5]|uniref:carboxymuconolactone decarboxylase family protein n=1 Tax=Amycolatopsis sp. H20-H5 TaxID=3046309 RepID=UPI002DB657EB|nr:carboxymuconolactone decarboxylase family protein [Amycolatopsis sp. H20-H5]MEC3975756.1 carboxymuconolactone decarboxylase family protein [Amycolatopsis sp. H20-H5]
MPTEFTVHDEHTAPAEAVPALEGARSGLGFISSLAGVMADSPELLAGYSAAFTAFMKSSLPLLGRHTVVITASVENGCEYCVAAHSTMAVRAGMPPGTLGALRRGEPTGDPVLDAIATLTRVLVTSRGHATEEDIDRFLSAGLTKRNVLEVVLGVGAKTISNYTNHLAERPLDQAWQEHAWENPKG